MSAENSRITSEKKEEPKIEKPLINGEEGKSSEQQQSKGGVVYEASQKESEEGTTKVVNLSKADKKNEQPRKGARYIGKPTYDHPVFSPQIMRANSPERYGVPAGLVASKVRRPQHKSS